MQEKQVEVFAVVADEVRNLAQRTGEATGDIEKMILQVQKDTKASVEAMEATVPQVQNGLALTHEANELLRNIQQQSNDSLEKVLEVVCRNIAASIYGVRNKQ